MYFQNNINVTVAENTARFIDVEYDTSAVAANNMIAAGKVAPDAKHGENGPVARPGALRVKYDVNTTVESNSAGYVGSYSNINSVFTKNDASSVRTHQCSCRLPALTPALSRTTSRRTRRQS